MAEPPTGIRGRCALLLPALLAACLNAAAQPAGTLPPIRIILVGDSTVAPHNGWGPGFCPLAGPAVDCVNLAKNGRSTSSYRAEGSWAQVMELLKDHSRAAWVLIQFGHNDQPGKPGRSTDLATEFPANLHRYAADVKSAGAHCVLVTSLSRRIFRAGVLDNSLAPWAEATKKVAGEEGIPVLDLNTESAAAVQKMGPVEANLFAMVPAPPSVEAGARQGESPSPPKAPSTVEPNGDPAPVFDYTHLGPKGAAFFGRMVKGELIAAIPELRPYFQP